MLFIFILLITFIILSWLFCFFYLNYFTVPTREIQKYKKILVIFPHPDDEVFSAGGLVKKTTSQGKKATIMILTKGEKGTADAQFNLKLKKIRTQELENVSSILQASNLIHLDLGDGELKNKKKELYSEIETVIEKEKPELIVTYDLSGLYGHDDHIVASEIITDIIKSKYQHITLWYATLPQKTLNKMKLPEHMATDKDFKKRRTVPTHKVFIGQHIFAKISAIHAYKSQKESFKKGMPVFIPPDFFRSMMLFEYFHEATKQRHCEE